MIETEFECPNCGTLLQGKVKYLLEVNVVKKEEPAEKKDGRDEKSEEIKHLWTLIDMDKLAIGDPKGFWKGWVPKVRKWFDDLGFLTSGQLEKLKQAVEISQRKGE